MKDPRKRPRLLIVVAALTLAVMACTCGALDSITGAVEDAQQTAEDVQDLAQDAQDLATQAAEVLPDDLPDIPDLENIDPSDIEIPDLGDLGIETVDSCALVTASEAEAVIGGAIADTVNSSGVCTYSGENGRSVSIVTQSLGSTEATGLFWSSMKSAAADMGDTEDVSGVWSEGFWEPSSSSLFALYESYVFIVNAGDIDTYPDAKDQAIQLLTTAIGRLP